ncbi:MAG: YicC family protein [Deltaproteobacteria bacterium]|nr:YicC family protein [Deltaproteobacteria bacterium]
MIKSMTGFGRAEATASGWRGSAEVRSVNGRHLDIRLRLPGGMNYLEEPFKKIIRTRLERGKIEGSIYLAPDGEGEQPLALNKPLMKGLTALVEEASTLLGRPVSISLGDLMGVRELVRFDAWESRRDQFEELLGKVLNTALDELLSMRDTEGKSLHSELEDQRSRLREFIDKVEPLSRDAPRQYAAKLKDNLEKLLGENLPDNDRLAQEIALFAERCDVSEELARFRTHLDHLEKLMREDGPVGRKIEFLLQEMNREANTLGVKSNDTTISALVIEIKSTLEKLREQIQNIE